MGNNDSAGRYDKTAGYFLLATGEMSADLYVTPGFTLYVHYSAAGKRVLREAFVKETVESLPLSVFIAHGYIRHASSKGRGVQCIWYHSYIIPKNHDLLGAIAFACISGILTRQKSTCCQ